MALSLTLTKVICLIVIIVLTLVFSVIPYFLVLRGSRSLVGARWREKMIANLNCFAGGVFLGTLLLHLLTEGSEEFDKYKSEAHMDTEFPLFNTFVGGGFFLVAFVELFMHRCLHIDSPGHSHDASTHSHGQYGALGNCEYDRIGEPDPVHDPHSNHGAGPSAESEPLMRSKMRCENGPVVGEGKADILSQIENIVEVRPAGSPEVNRVLEAPPGILRAFLLLVALSFHTVFDGLAVGLQKDTSEVWQVFVAICVHKSIIAFCLGLELFKCYLADPCKAFFWLCLFSLMSPVGIGLGIYLTSGGVSEMAKLLSSGILQGLAAGTFLYVTFLEILCIYVGHHCRGEFLHVVSALLGFCFMSVVKLLDHD